MNKCKWFSMCANDAVTTLPHPVLGLVPVCDRCLDASMSRTEFGDYDGVYNMPTILYRLRHDANAGSVTDEDPMDLEDAIENWEIDMGQLLCIPGLWKDVGYGTGDPTSPDWDGLGVVLDPDVVIQDNGVYYAGPHMVIVGGEENRACYWIFHKATTNKER